MANIKQIKVGNTTYNIEPYSSYYRSGCSNFEMNNGGSLLGYGGFIDFHFFNSSGKPLNSEGTVVSTTPDYTSRIIEDSAGRIAINGKTYITWSGLTSSSITSNGSVDANSARISNGLYVGSSITHNPSGNLVIGNSDNSHYVKFVEDVVANGWSISVNGDISTRGGISTDATISTPTLYAGYLNNVEKFSFQSNSPTPGITMKAYNSGDGEYYYNFIGFAPMQENDPAILSNSGYIALYDAGPGGEDCQLTMEDSPTGRISLSDWHSACQQSWRKTQSTNQVNKKLFLIGASNQSTSEATQSNSKVYIGTDNNLYSNGKKTAVEELTMPVTKRSFREHSSEYKEALVDEKCKHFSLIDLYVKDDSGEINDVNFVLNIFGTINVVWGYSYDTIENSAFFPAGAGSVLCRDGVRLVGYINHLTKSFTGNLMRKPHSSSTETKIKTYTNQPITNFSASIDHCIIDGAMIWWSLDSASTDIKAL